MSNTEHRPTSRVLNILEILATNSDGFTLTEIAEKINAPKSTILPIVHTMAERKFINIDRDSGKYTIGISTFSVGAAFSSNKNILQYINSEMKYIVEVSKEICQLGILKGNNVLYIDKVDSEEAIRLVSHIGKMLPAYCTSLGKALICEMELDEVKKLYPTGLKSYTKNTITDFDVLFEQLLEIRKSNISMEFEEISEHLICCATPIRYNNKIIAAISVSIPAFRATQEKLSITSEVLINAKGKIEKYLETVGLDEESFLY